jgi:hypothetical protein
VIVAVLAVRMVQMTVHQVIDVIAMRDCFVTAAFPVHMSGVVAAAWRGATVGILGADFDDVFFGVIAYRMFQMPVVQVIDVPVVLHRKAWVICGVVHMDDLLRFKLTSA